LRPSQIIAHGTRGGREEPGEREEGKAWKEGREEGRERRGEERRGWRERKGEEGERR
jgi:hypothetical protein